MSIFAQNIKNILKSKNSSIFQFSKLIDYHDGALNAMINGKKSIPENVKEKLIQFLEVSREEFEGWIIADKYPKEALKLAVQIKKDFPYKKKSVLTTKIDEILQHKNMSRTALAKQINYSQSGLNQIITGKRSVPKSVLEKLSDALDISRNNILSWILADEYNLQTLKTACSITMVG